MLPLVTDSREPLGPPLLSPGVELSSPPTVFLFFSGGTPALALSALADTAGGAAASAAFGTARLELDVGGCAPEPADPKQALDAIPVKKDAVKLIRNEQLKKVLNQRTTAFEATVCASQGNVTVSRQDIGSWLVSVASVGVIATGVWLYVEANDSGHGVTVTGSTSSIRLDLAPTGMLLRGTF